MTRGLLTQIIVAVMVILVAAALHLTTCRWHTWTAHEFAADRAQAQSWERNPPTTMDELAASDLSWLLAVAMERAIEEDGAIWVHRNRWGDGTALFPRHWIGTKLATQLGVTVPSGMIIALPFTLFVIKRNMRIGCALLALVLCAGCTATSQAPRSSIAKQQWETNWQLKTLNRQKKIERYDW